MERTDNLNQLKQFNRLWEYDCCDIAESWLSCQICRMTGS